MSQPHYFSYSKTGRYFLSGHIDGPFQNICFALHGYGQLGKYFVRHFKASELSSTLFIVPEAPHRFYLSGSQGRVGASWMTKEDRLRDIEDYCNYLNELYRIFLPQVKAAKKVGILGFSQGVATACRWLTESNLHFDFLINYAGVFPPDLDPEQSLKRMQKLKLHLLLGDKDEYLELVDFEKNVHTWQQLGYPLQSEVFEGTHKIYPQVLASVFKNL